jgi:NADPH:quinone reductase-like Zn-dependent oxidoreductase
LYQGRSRGPPAELIQFGEKVADLHGRCVKDPPGSGGPPALCCGQATVKRLSDYVGDRCTALPCDRANPLVTLIVDENLQPMRQHTHTLACTYSDTGSTRTAEWWSWARGELHTVVHEQLPLEQAALAHQKMDAGEVFGRIVLTP